MASTIISTFALTQSRSSWDSTVVDVVPALLYGEKQKTMD